jgi:arylsulfatase A-like enzyme
MGQEALLARRLAEAGVPFTLVNFSLNQIKGQDWDTHVDNFGLLKRELLPPMDRAVSVLLCDLDERGLLDSTLVCVVSEFGRTPRITADSGRDHWPNVFSLLIAGGGLARGQVIGASTRAGDEPFDRPVHLYDVLATIYRQLGVPRGEVFRDLLGRPLPVLSGGKVIEELIG